MTLVAQAAQEFAVAATPKATWSPVEPVWRYEPPKHRLWIEPFNDTALLVIALFGQVIGAVPLNNLPAASDPSARSIDPSDRSMYHSTFPAIWLGTATARLTGEGHNVVTVAVNPDRSFIFAEDGPTGPVEMPIPTMRADSPTHALELFMSEEGPTALRPIHSPSVED